MAQKVLVIDNADMVHKLVGARLRDEELEIHGALDGTSGLAMARSLQPDVILLDVRMPDLDGFAVCAALKADSATVNIPVIFLTAVDDVEQKIRGLDLGAVDYVTKPFDGAELKARVRASLRTKRLADLLSRRAMIDGLTELWGRAYFESRLASETSIARRVGRPLACVMCDVDHFKGVNDNHGHPTGDKVLRHVAVALTQTCRQEDVVCRYGGEEFVVLCPNTDAAAAGMLAERIRAAVAGIELSHRQTPFGVTCSLGVADLTTGPDVVAAADDALYRAKQGGRNRVAIATTRAAAA